MDATPHILLAPRGVTEDRRCALTVRLADTSEWTVTRDFSQLAALHEDLCDYYGPEEIPALPAKKTPTRALWKFEDLPEVDINAATASQDQTGAAPASSHTSPGTGAVDHDSPAERRYRRVVAQQKADVDFMRRRTALRAERRYHFRKQFGLAMGFSLAALHSSFGVKPQATVADTPTASSADNTNDPAGDSASAVEAFPTTTKDGHDGLGGEKKPSLSPQQEDTLVQLFVIYEFMDDCLSRCASWSPRSTIGIPETVWLGRGANIALERRVEKFLEVALRGGVADHPDIAEMLVRSDFHSNGIQGAGSGCVFGYNNPLHDDNQSHCVNFFTERSVTAEWVKVVDDLSNFRAPLLLHPAADQVAEQLLRATFGSGGGANTRACDGILPTLLAAHVRFILPEGAYKPEHDDDCFAGDGLQYTDDSGGAAEAALGAVGDIAKTMSNIIPGVDIPDVKLPGALTDGTAKLAGLGKGLGKGLFGTKPNKAVEAVPSASASPLAATAAPAPGARASESLSVSMATRPSPSTLPQQSPVKPSPVLQSIGSASDFLSPGSAENGSEFDGWSEIGSSVSQRTGMSAMTGMSYGGNSHLQKLLQQQRGSVPMHQLTSATPLEVLLSEAGFDFSDSGIDLSFWIEVRLAVPDKCTMSHAVKRVAAAPPANPDRLKNLTAGQLLEPSTPKTNVDGGALAATKLVAARWKLTKSVAELDEFQQKLKKRFGSPPVSSLKQGTFFPPTKENRARKTLGLVTRFLNKCTQRWVRWPSGRKFGSIFRPLAPEVDRCEYILLSAVAEFLQVAEHFSARHVTPEYLETVESSGLNIPSLFPTANVGDSSSGAGRHEDRTSARVGSGPSSAVSGAPATTAAKPNESRPPRAVPAPAPATTKTTTTTAKPASEDATAAVNSNSTLPNVSLVTDVSLSAQTSASFTTSNTSFFKGASASTVQVRVSAAPSADKLPETASPGTAADKRGSFSSEKATPMTDGSYKLTAEVALPLPAEYASKVLSAELIDVKSQKPVPYVVAARWTFTTTSSDVHALHGKLKKHFGCPPVPLLDSGSKKKTQPDVAGAAGAADQSSLEFPIAFVNEVLAGWQTWPGAGKHLDQTPLAVDDAIAPVFSTSILSDDAAAASGAMDALPATLKASPGFTELIEMERLRPAKSRLDGAAFQKIVGEEKLAVRVVTLSSVAAFLNLTQRIADPSSWTPQYLALVSQAVVARRPPPSPSTKPVVTAAPNAAAETTQSGTVGSNSTEAPASSTTPAKVDANSTGNETLSAAESGSPQPRRPARPEPVPLTASPIPTADPELEELEATPLRSPTEDPPRPASVPPLPLPLTPLSSRRSSQQPVHIGPSSEQNSTSTDVASTEQQQLTQQKPGPEKSNTKPTEKLSDAERESLAVVIDDATAQARVKVPSFSTCAAGDHVDFEVHVSFHGRSWTVKRRYAEFVALHKSMVKHFPVIETVTSDVVIDDPKTVWAPSWKKKNAELCQKRREFFHRYLKLLVCQVDLWDDDRAHRTSVRAAVPEEAAGVDAQPYIVRFNSLLCDFLGVASNLSAAAARS